MAEKQDVGLFLVKGLKTEGKTIRQAWCRVVLIDVMSAQPPQNNRLLTYKVGFWDHQPDPLEEPELFRCPLTGQQTFARRLPIEAVTQDDLIANAINHFVGLVLPQKSLRTFADAQSQLFNINKAPWPYHSDDDSCFFSIYDAQHHEAYTATAGENLGAAYSVVSYRALITMADDQPTYDWSSVDWDALPRLQFSGVWDNPTQMLEDAKAHFLSEGKAALYRALNINA